MLQRIDRTVDARPLAVPNAKHAIDLGAGKQSNLLAAPYRGRGEILVEAGREDDVVRLQFGASRATALVVMPSGEPR